MPLPSASCLSPADVAALLPFLLDESSDLILRFDASARYTFVNPAHERATGWSAERCLGWRPDEAPAYGAVASASLHGALRRVLADPSQAMFELRWTAPDGEPCWHVCRMWQVGDGLLLIGRDVTEHRLVERALIDREREFRTLAENSPDNIIRYDLDLRAVYCNKEIAGRMPTSPSLVLGRRPLEAAPPGLIGGEAYERVLAHTLASGEPGSVEIQVPDLEGRLRTHTVAFSPEFDSDGNVDGAVAVGRDITPYVEVRQALANKEREFRSLAENMDDHVCRWALDGRFLYVNPALAVVLGAPAEALLGRMPTELFPDGRYETIVALVRQVAREGAGASLEQRLQTDTGVVVHQVRMMPERDEHGAVRSVLGVGRDITASTRQFELIEQLARTDALTQLSNRQALYDQAPALLAAASRHDRRVGLMLLDLDQFKAINDGMGHTAGDVLLREVARRLSSCIRAYDLLARLGGDEFVIVIPDLESASQMETVAAKVHDTLAGAIAVDGREVRITASIGIAVGPDDGEALEALLAHADAAMYHAKRSGRGRTQYYRSELSAAVRERLALEEAMRDAQHGNGLQLLFQPVTQLADGRVLGAEALLRWHHPTHGLVMPDVFIPIAEETGMIVPMGRWVLRNAAEAVVRWNRGRAVPLRVAVNVSTRQFVLDDMAEVVAQSLRAAGCPPEWLAVEITESLLIEDSCRVQLALRTLRAMGVAVAIDDFGTGYSALNYLARFDVDVLKIDRSFVQGIDAGKRPAELVKAFLAMAQALGLVVVAEGIETEAQANFLLAHGCPLGQGWHFGRPMPAAAFEARLRAGEPVGVT